MFPPESRPNRVNNSPMRGRYLIMTGVGYSGRVLPHNSPKQEGIKREVNKLKYRGEPGKGGKENELYTNPHPPSQSKGN